MEQDQFNRILSRAIQRTVDVLEAKAGEYATKDRLHNFKKAAALKGETARQALAGMMSKHTVSVYDMMMSSEFFTPEQWAEKIGDHINYLILLEAIVAEEYTDLDQRMLDFTPKETPSAR